jgi:hypothetical protein
MALETEHVVASALAVVVLMLECVGARVVKLAKLVKSL